HGFSLGTETVRVSVNGVYASWDTPLSDNDEVVFIPPVAGG
ncbi:MAG: MoaD/ThiS family protein, partial [Candidatus Omnitrophica bacterium]|nr:MoaD/ThiS family protein [Candidatus Omnitrophota bacterium]